MVYKPHSKVSYAKATLPYPLFAAEFDPYNRGYLVVGGGGGESKTGVPNQISVLDVSDRAAITTAATIDLSRGEDSVQSISSLATKDGLITFAGINSSEADQTAGNNEHFRSFEIKYPPRKKQKTEKEIEDEQGTIKALNKRALFKTSTAARKETYQRLLRLSPAQKRTEGSKRIGAVATGMAKDSELIVFNATVPAPDKADIITRIDLPFKEEVADLDIAEPVESQFSLAYCTETNIYEQIFKYDFPKKKAEKTPAGPRRVYQMPAPEASEKTTVKPKFRALRFLNSQNVITLVNKANKSGVELRIYHLYPTGPAMMLLQKALPARVKQAVSMDVCALDADKNGNQQFVIAIAGQDISIEVYTTNFQPKTETFSPFKNYLTLKDVHQHQMTKVCFSPFHSPTRAADSEKGKLETPTHPGPQYIRLASVTYGNTVVVDTFPISPVDPKDKNSRYVLHSADDDQWTFLTYGFIISIIVLVIAFIFQAFVSGFANDNAGMWSVLPKDMRDFLDAPARAAGGFGRRAEYTIISAVDESVPSAIPGKARLLELIDTHLEQNAPNNEEPQPRKAIVVRDDSAEGSSLSFEVHDDKNAYLEKDTEAKHWDELEEHQKAVWRERLIRAGEWAEGEGEKVLIGVLFSSYAGMIGGIAREAMNA
ncbi:Hypothetical protein R9X50_00031300 [Acrodontium crateriforme]|uniref:Guanine nucleotide-exchange factor SEC12 n=1 Tax=Acrodontium crateriforme TaxID=150365 RepID=A0AAQ3LX14_9PEZI|nr:Hypothetical protein R9X50_00031300 [Acrodontium crateriforme]